MIYKVFKSLFSPIDKIKDTYKIFRYIIHLRKIKPKYLFFSENKSYQKFSYLLIEALAKKNPKAVIVSIACDRGDRYLSTGIFPA